MLLGEVAVEPLRGKEVTAPLYIHNHSHSSSLPPLTLQPPSMDPTQDTLSRVIGMLCEMRASEVCSTCPPVTRCRANNHDRHQVTQIWKPSSWRLWICIAMSSRRTLDGCRTWKQLDGVSASHKLT
jgi:hypothetical protein